MIKNKMLRLRFFIMLVLSSITSQVMMLMFGSIPERGTSVGIGRFSREATSVSAKRTQEEIRSENERRNKISIESYATYKKTNGIDQRPPINTTLLLTEYGNLDAINKYLPNRNPGDINKIRRFFVKKELLNILENPDISSHVKIGILTEFEEHPRPPNISAGGLMSDFDFEF